MTTTARLPVLPVLTVSAKPKRNKPGNPAATNNRSLPEAHALAVEFKLIACQALRDASEARDSASNALQKALDIAFRARLAATLVVSTPGSSHAIEVNTRQLDRARYYADQARSNAATVITSANLAEFFHNTATKAAHQARTAASLPGANADNVAAEALRNAGDAKGHYRHAKESAKAARQVVREI